jgi:hypothetical protein
LLIGIQPLLIGIQRYSPSPWARTSAARQPAASQRFEDWIPISLKSLQLIGLVLPTYT